MSVSSTWCPRATTLPTPNLKSGEKIHRADSSTLVSSESSCASTSETQSIEDSDIAKVAPTFRLLVVTAPGGSSRKFVKALETKCRNAGLPVKMIGDGKGSIIDDLMDLPIDDSLPTMAIYFGHGGIRNGDHVTWLEDDDDAPPNATSSVLELLHLSGVARTTVFACHAGAAAEEVGPRHLSNVGDLPASYLFFGRHDDASNRYIARDDVDGLVDYYCSCAKDGLPPDGLKEHLLMAQISAQTFRYVQASADPGGSPVIVQVPAVDSALGCGKQRIRDATIQADSRRERKEVRFGLEEEFREFKHTSQGNAVIVAGKATLPERALAQQIHDGNHVEVQNLLTRGVKPDWNGRDTTSGLQMAVGARDPGMLARVLAHADQSQINNTAGVSMTPLVFAVRSEAQSHLDVLLALGADPDQPCSAGTPLTISTVFNNGGMVKSLLRHQADPNAPDRRGVLPLEIAVAKNRKPMALRLLKGGAKPDATASHGNGALMAVMGSGSKTGLRKMASYAFWSGEFKIAKMLRKLKKRNAAAGARAGIPG